MKKINKLQINSETIMKNEELMTLRGGYSINCCKCVNTDTNEIVANMITTKDYCDSDCHEIYAAPIHGVWFC